MAAGEELTCDYGYDPMDQVINTNFEASNRDVSFKRIQEINLLTTFCIFPVSWCLSGFADYGTLRKGRIVMMPVETYFQLKYISVETYIQLKYIFS